MYIYTQAHHISLNNYIDIYLQNYSDSVIIRGWDLFKASIYSQNICYGFVAVLLAYTIDLSIEVRDGVLTCCLFQTGLLFKVCVYSKRDSSV